MKTESENLILYNQDRELDLSPTQLKVIFEILKIKFNDNGTYNCRLDNYSKIYNNYS